MHRSSPLPRDTRAGTRSLSRRAALAATLAGGAALGAALGGCAAPPARANHLGRVVVVGGGFGGATAAKYLRLWSAGAIEVVLVEPNPAFVSCPISNLVLGGHRELSQLTLGYDGLVRRGVRVVHDRAVALDAAARRLHVAAGAPLSYDRLVVAPGIELLPGRIAGFTPEAQAAMPHAWKAGEQTLALRRRLVEMPDDGTVVVAMPAAPYRCPPGPYERACQIASYLKRTKPRSKLLLLDANPDIVSKKALFARVFAEDYAGLVEYRPNHRVIEVDATSRTLVTDMGERVRGDVVNLVPPQRAGEFAHVAGLLAPGESWCRVDWMTMESLALPGVHVLGDATASAPGMPKSGHMANQHGKAAAAAIVALMSGHPPEPPRMANTCYSFIDGQSAVHVASVHRWVPEKRTLEPVPGAGGVSGHDRAAWLTEGQYAWGWARTIWADMLS
ncbi:MAG: FAD-dependent oxidoreductase [Rubrivivax sp.]|nr:FAD-dependent oxidoreductase [Rubrivivax sp.]